MTGTSSGGSAWRIWAVMMLMALPAAGIVIRLFSLQVVEHQKFADLAETNQNQIVDVEPWRGQIFDRTGVALAVNQVEYEISASPDIVTSTHTVAERLAPLLNRPRAEIQSQLDTPDS